MKKKISALLSQEHAILSISHAAQLRRFSGIISGTPQDHLYLEFVPLGGNAQIHQQSIKIESRDPDEIIRFCADMMEAHFAQVAQQIAQNILNGYNDASNTNVRSIP